MNIQENIDRIREVMGLNESKIPSSVKRRANEETLKKYITMGEIEYPALCDDFYDEFEYTDRVIDYALDQLLYEINDNIDNEDYYSDVMDYLRKLCENIFGQYLIDIYKTTCSDSLNESTLPTIIRRRIGTSKDLRKEIRGWIMRLYKDGNKDITISKAYNQVANDLMFYAGLEDVEYDVEDTIKKVKKYLIDQYQTEMEQFYDGLFGDDDLETYCFIKHSERYGGLRSRGFSDCINGWNNFLSKYGYWLPHLDWNEIKKKLNESPPKTNLLLAKPLEGHIYEYYFSVNKRQ